MKKHILLIIGTLAASACWLAQADEMVAKTPQATRYWVSPMAFKDVNEGDLSPEFAYLKGALIRDDYLSLFKNTDTWAETLARTDVFKFNIGLLNGRQPQLPEFGTSDGQLENIITFLKANKIKTAIEVSGLKPPFDNCSDIVTSTSEMELKLLKRWMRLGGTIDYIVFDHPIGNALQAQDWDLSTEGRALPISSKCSLSYREIITAAASAMARVWRELRPIFPRVKLGITESLSYYSFKMLGVNNREYLYSTLAPLRYPRLWFETVAQGLLEESKIQRFAIDHFAVDFNDGYFADARDHRHESPYVAFASGTPIRDYGRMVAATNILRKYGFKIAYVANATGQTSDDVTRKTLTFYREISDLLGPFDHEVFQFWHSVPAKTVPETSSESATYIFRKLFSSNRN